MELAAFIAVVSLQLVIIGWLLAHSLQCAKRDGRVSAIEEWKKSQEKGK